MGFDYTNAKKTSERLIKHYGRTISLIKRADLNSNKPWTGPDSSKADEVISIPGVQLLPNQVRIFGLAALGESSTLEELILKVEYVYVVFPGEHDIKRFTILKDENIEHVIDATQVLRPGNTNLLAYIGTRR